MKKLKLSPDWSKLSKIFLVYPSMREDIKDEFVNFLKTISETISKKQDILLIIHPTKAKEFEDNLKSNNINFENYKSLEYDIILDKLFIKYWFIEANDIWCRDYLPINASVIENLGTFGNHNYDLVEKALIKPMYDPNYGFNTPADNSIGIKVAEKFCNDRRTFYFPIKWDGGNLSTNGEYMIVTDKIFSENWNFTKNEVISLFEKNFYTKLIVIPSEPLDTIGHSDSIAVFLDEKTILLPIYPDEFRIDNRYINTVYNTLLKELPSDYNFIFLPCSLSDVISEENIFSAAGCFLNYFRIENNLYFPSFSDLKEEQHEIKRILNKYDENLNIYFCECDKISYFGGALHCISSSLNEL